MAVAHQINTIAFPLIATGGFGYPKEEGFRIAIDEINAFLMKHEMTVYLVVFDKKATQIGNSLSATLETYIDRNYVEEKKDEEYFGNKEFEEMSISSSLDMYSMQREEAKLIARRRLCVITM